MVCQILENSNLPESDRIVRSQEYGSCYPTSGGSLTGGCRKLLSTASSTMCDFFFFEFGISEWIAWFPSGIEGGFKSRHTLPSWNAIKLLSSKYKMQSNYCHLTNLSAFLFIDPVLTTSFFLYVPICYPVWTDRFKGTLAISVLK